VPRSIIDTESSRPRAVRRRLLTAALLLLLLAAAAVLAWELAGRPRHIAIFPGNSAQRLNLGLREQAT
jgi:ferric-dicitrate binding protein FerR (iron transport regulator)